MTRDFLTNNLTKQPSKTQNSQKNHNTAIMSDPETRNIVSKAMIEKALWNCCVSLSLTEILPNLYLGGSVFSPSLQVGRQLYPGRRS